MKKSSNTLIKDEEDEKDFPLKVGARAKVIYTGAPIRYGLVIRIYISNGFEFVVMKLDDYNDFSSHLIEYVLRV